MAKTEYNWWKDPKNKEEVDRLSWWNHEQNKKTYPFPISVVQEGEWWIASCNEETEKLIGDRLHGCSQGKTKEEAIKNVFEIIKFSHEYSEECRLNYQRFVPFRKGDWKQAGGRWFVIFGIHFYFRYGKGMQGGWYIPFTKLNISIYSEWATYRKFKKQRSKAK